MNCAGNDDAGCDAGGDGDEENCRLAKRQGGSELTRQLRLMLTCDEVVHAMIEVEADDVGGKPERRGRLPAAGGEVITNG